MPETLGRWRMTGVIGARPVPVDDRARQVARQRMRDASAKPAQSRQARPGVTYTHIHVHGAAYDAAPKPRRRGRDQGEPVLLCRIAQDGRTGEWAAQDADGNPLVVQQGAQGLEIFGLPGDGEAQQGALGMHRPPGAAGEVPGQDARRRVGDYALRHPGSRTPNDDCAALAAWQDALNRHYAQG